MDIRFPAKEIPARPQSPTRIRDTRGDENAAGISFAGNLRIWTLAQRPDLEARLWAMEEPWPVFMCRDPIGTTYHSLTSAIFPEYILLAEDTSRGNPGEIVAKATCVPFVVDGEELFNDGWDGMIRRAVEMRIRGATPNIIGALEVAIRRDMQGKGLAAPMLEAVLNNGARLGYQTLVVAVRPNQKARYPTIPMPAYAYATREKDGLPIDPWLRVHVRAGGRLETICARSMVVPGTLNEWRAWTDLPFDSTGPVVLPDALAPVQCDAENDYAVYIESNVWVRHNLKHRAVSDTGNGNWAVHRWAERGQTYLSSSDRRFTPHNHRMYQKSPTHDLHPQNHYRPLPYSPTVPPSDR